MTCHNNLYDLKLNQLDTISLYRYYKQLKYEKYYSNLYNNNKEQNLLEARRILYARKFERKCERNVCNDPRNRPFNCVVLERNVYPSIRNRCRNHFECSCYK